MRTAASLALLTLAGCWTGSAAPTTTTTTTTSPPPRTEARQLLGTVWTGADVDGQMTFRFRADGKLNYTNSNGTWDNGRWKQDGTRILVDMNDHYADYVGTIRGDTMSGNGSNITGKKWTWSLRRVSADLAR